MCSAPRQYDEVNGRVREGRGREERNNSGNVVHSLTGEESGDERGFEYTTTANIARHLRSDGKGGMFYCVMIIYHHTLPGEGVLISTTLQL